MDNGLFQICDFQQILCIIYLKGLRKQLVHENVVAL